MKKLICLICVTAMLAGLTACGKKSENFCGTFDNPELQDEFVRNYSEYKSKQTTVASNAAEAETSAEVIEKTSDMESETAEYESSADGAGLSANNEAEYELIPAEERRNIQGSLFDESAIDTKYNEEEAEQVKEIAQTVVDSMASGDVHAFAQSLVEYSDVDMTYYGGFGNRVSDEELISLLEDELKYLSNAFDGTSEYDAADIQIAGADDEFWKFISLDSEMMQDIDESYDYDMSEIYTFDKAYRITYDVHDEINPDNEETGVFVYIARTNEGEWKFEVMFNFFYEEYTNPVYIEQSSVIDKKD